MEPNIDFDWSVRRRLLGNSEDVEIHLSFSLSSFDASPRKASVENENRMITTYSNKKLAFKIEDLNDEMDSLSYLLKKVRTTFGSYFSKQ